MTGDALARLLVDGVVDTGKDPRATQELGEALAEPLRASRVDAVACWEGDDEAALAQVVGVVLGVPVLRAEEGAGLLTLSAHRPSGTRIGLLGVRWDLNRPVVPLAGLVRGQGLDVVVAVSVLGGVGELDVPMHALGER